MRPRQHGVTLMEIVMTVAIVAILSTLAGPSFAGLLHDAERATTVNAFLQSLLLARSEALTRNGPLSISVEVIHGHAWSPDERRSRRTGDEVRVPVEILRTRRKD